MRLSTDKDDRGYKLWQALTAGGIVIEVFLDGVKQDLCDIVDTKEGYVRRAVVNADNKICLDPTDDEDQVHLEIVRGKIRLFLDGDEVQ